MLRGLVHNFVKEAVVQYKDEWHYFDHDKLNHQDKWNEKIGIIAVAWQQETHAEELAASVKSIPALEDP